VVRVCARVCARKRVGYLQSDNALNLDKAHTRRCIQQPVCRLYRRRRIVTLSLSLYVSNVYDVHMNLSSCHTVRSPSWCARARFFHFMFVFACCCCCCVHQTHTQLESLIPDVNKVQDFVPPQRETQREVQREV